MHFGGRRAEEVLSCGISEDQKDERARKYTLRRNRTQSQNFVFLSKEEKKQGIFEVQDRAYIPKSCQGIRRREKERGGSEEFSQSARFSILALTFPEL